MCSGWLSVSATESDSVSRSSGMKLVPDGASWRIKGPGCERARVAYARLDGDRVVYEFGQSQRAASA